MAEREWFDKDYYKVLGLTPSATDKEITRAYRKLAKEHHPDTNKGSEDKFKEISVAYDVLGDAAKRKEYDDVRKMGPSAAGFGGQQRGGPQNFNFNQGNVGDLGDIFGGLFGNQGRRSRAQRGADIETALHISFRDAVFGVTTTVPLPSNDACHTCGGRGGAPGSGFVTCELCQGRGVLNNDQGGFGMSSVCPTCHGKGGRIVTPCAKCHGTGREPSSRRVNVRIPAGVIDGQRIRLKGKGNPGAGGGPAGDLFVDIHAGTDEVFARKNRHVTTSVKISPMQAMLGDTVEVATLDDPVTLKIAAGTQGGSTLRVRGRGVPAGGNHPVGDLLVTVDVVIPKKLNKEQRTLVEKLSKSFNEEVTNV